MPLHATSQTKNTGRLQVSTKPQDDSPESTPPIFNIVGENVALGPLRKDLVPLYTRWFNDFGTLRTLGRDARTAYLGTGRKVVRAGDIARRH